MSAQPKVTTISDVLAEIDQQQAALKRSIDQSNALLAADSVQQKQLQTNLGALGRTASDLSKARDEGNKASADVAKALTTAQSLIDEMDTAAKKSIQSTIDDLDKGIATQNDAVKTANTDVDQVRDELAPIQHSVDLQIAAFDAAVGKLTQLSATIQASIGRLQKFTTDLRAATDAGQSRKVVVLAAELTQENKQLAAWTTTQYEATLVAAYKKAGNDLKTARDALAAKQGELADKQATLDSASKTLAQLQADREARLKDLMARQDDPVPQGQPSSADQAPKTPEKE